MKKVLIILLVLFLTGCGNKDNIDTLTCHNNSNDEIRLSRINMTGTFKNDILESITIDGKISSEDKKALLEDKEFYDWFYGDMSKIDGITFSSDLDDNYTFKVVMKIDDIPNNSLFDKSELPTNKDEFVKYAGNQGYACEEQSKKDN